MRKGNRTVMTMSNSYQGPPDSFAMVVPVPVVLQKENVKTLPFDVFDRVDSLSRAAAGRVLGAGPLPAADAADAGARVGGDGHGSRRGAQQEGDATWASRSRRSSSPASTRS